MAHVLDRPIWASLETRHTHFREGGDLAVRYPQAVSPFVAGRSASPESLAAMIALIGEGEEISIVETDPPAAPPGVLETRLPLFQMVWESFSSDASIPDIQPLGKGDAEEMLALASLTRPGPFRVRTHQMGRFVGVRENGRLIAMAGERLHAPGFHEISAVCTHPEFRGRGLGPAMMRAVGARILDEGDQPFLHTYVSNAIAVELYRKLGFVVRAELTHAMWKRGSGEPA